MTGRIIRMTADGVLDAPEWKAENGYLRSLIGEKCDIYDHVRPDRLYTEFKCPDYPDRKAPGRCIIMLMDEEANYHALPVNPVASWLYGFDKHGCAIRGTVLFVGEMLGPDGVDFCALDDFTGLALLAILQKAISLFEGLDGAEAFSRKEG